MGNVITQEQWESLEQDERTSSGGTHHRCQIYEDGGNEQRQRRMETSTEGGQGPVRAVAP